MFLTIESTLNAIKIVHTVVWAAFVSWLLAFLLFAWQAEVYYATLSIGIVCVEVLVLILNRWRCPLTSVAARYTCDRRANSDIYLPEWLARHNKLIFGTLYVAGIIFTLARWAYESA
jgi:hypothetical protein